MKRQILIIKLKKFQQKDANNLKKRTWYENRIYWEREEKLEKMVLTDFFLTHRNYFKNTILALWCCDSFGSKSTEEVLRSMFDVGEYDFIQHKKSEDFDFDVYLHELTPIFETERQSIVREITKTNYSLFSS